MIKKKLHTFFYGSSFYGVEHTSQNGVDVLNISTFENKKDELIIEETFIKDEVTSLKTIIKQTTKVVLSINTSQVITKIIDSSNEDASKILNRVFSNINLEDFYYQIVKQSQKTLVSICRKSVIETILNDYKKNKISVLDFYLGSMPLISIIPYLEVNQLESFNNSYQITSNNIESINKLELESSHLINYDINGIKITSQNIIPFSAVLAHLQSNVTLNNFDALKKECTNHFNTKRVHGLLLSYGLGLVFLTLLINVFFFSSYFKKVEGLRPLSYVNLNSKTKLIKLSKSVNEKQNLVDEIYSISQSKLSLVSNKIMTVLPESILLSNFEINPLLKAIKQKKEIQLNQNLILVSGETTSKSNFTKWILDLENFKWIETIDILLFEDQKKSSSFKIQINYNNNLDD